MAVPKRRCGCGEYRAELYQSPRRQHATAKRTRNPMAPKPRKPAERIKDFKALAHYKASTAKEGDIDAPIFDGSAIRRIIHNEMPYCSLVDVVGALTETASKDPGLYWRALKKRLIGRG